MNERYPDATAEELEATGDRTCIICREQMVHGGEPGRERTRPKKLRCGHILHFHCLRSWLERQQNCPTWYSKSRIYLICSRRPVLEDAPARQPPANRAAPPGQVPLPMPPPVPPAAMPAQPGAVPTPTTPGPTPTPIQRPGPRIAAGAPINLPPGYTLPPGWAVIPAHNVQIIPPITQSLAGAVSPTVQVVVQGLSGGTVAQQGPPAPGPATSPVGGGGDVTIPNNDQVAPPSGQTAAPPRSPTNTNSPPSTAPPNPQISNLQALMQQRTAGHRMLATQSPHPSFPIAIPLGPPGAYANRTAPATTRTDGTAEPPTVRPPRPPFTSSENGDPDERSAILSQMNDSVRAMQGLLARMNSLAQPPPPATSAVSPTPATSPVPLSSPPSTSTVLQPISTNGHNPETSTPLRSTPTHNRIYKRQSMSPVDPPGENEPHSADRLHRLSSDDEELSPEDLADIKAPWVEQPLDDELPLQEVRTSRQNSPPRMRSSSQSPHRQLRRRGSLLRHEITEEILDDEREREKVRTLGSLELEDTVVAPSPEGVLVDKGKGKAVVVEDGEDDGP